MAGVPRAAGYQDYSSTSTNAYVPVVYSSKLVVKFYATTVFASISSTQYEGEIKGLGDNVIIRTTPDVVVADYQIGSTFSPTDYQTPASAATSLAINKAKAFLVRLNTVDRAQSDLDLAETFADDASMQLKIAMDRDLLGNIYLQAGNAGAAAGPISGNLNLGTTGAPVGINSTTVLEYILRHGQVLDEQNVSDEGRWLILPSWMIKKLKQSPLSQAYLTGDDETILRNGRVGTVRQNLLTA